MKSANNKKTYKTAIALVDILESDLLYRFDWEAKTGWQVFSSKQKMRFLKLVKKIWYTLYRQIDIIWTIVEKLRIKLSVAAKKTEKVM